MPEHMADENRAEGGIKLVATHGARRFEIVESTPEVGFYVYIYEGDRCTHDYLQDTLERAKSFAEEEFGVPAASWTHADNI